MAHRTEQDWLAGERVVEVSPRFEPQVGDPVPRRLNHVSGRTLTAEALATEQTHRDSRTQMLSRALVPGIVEGLEARLVSAEAGNAEVVVNPGRGVTHGGEDLVLHRPISAALDSLPAAEPLAEEDERPVGLVLLSLKPVRAVSALAADPEDSCPIDPDAHVYDDLVTVDGAKLVWTRLDDGDPVAIPPTPADRVRALRQPRLRMPGPGRFPMPNPRGGGLSLRRVLVPPQPLLGRATARAQALTKLRNDVAYRLFAEEAETAARGEPPRWAKHGLPVAVVQVTAAGEVIFLDRFAVARMGGAPRRATPSDAMGSPLSLRRARFDQFVAHIQDLRTEGAPLAPATQHFGVLPPVGVLPATLVDFHSMQSEFFPPNYRVEAAPVPIEQFEAILSARSGLDPYEFGAPDYVQIIVPVPEHLYEPRLLLRETVDPVFQDAIDETAVAISGHAAMLAHLQGLETAVVGLVDLASVADPVPARTDAPGSGVTDFAGKALELVVDLFESARQLPLTNPEKASVHPSNFIAMVNSVGSGEGEGDRNSQTFKGLKPVIDELKVRLEKANDFIDMGFVRLQADIYRARKHLVGEDDATRLATSPVLANLASTATGVETSNLIRDFFTKQRIGKALPDTSGALQLPPQAGTATEETGGTVGAAHVLAPQFHVMSMKLAGAQVKGTTALSHSVLASAVSTSLIAKSLSASTSVLSTTAATMSPQAIIGSQFASLKSDLASARLNAQSISWQGLVYSKGSPIRTVTVAERLRHSPAQEAKNAAVATKAEVVRGLQATGINLEGLLLPVTAGRTILVKDSDIDRLANGQDGLTRPPANVVTVLRNANAAPLDDGIRMINEAHLLASAIRLFPCDTNIVRQVEDVMSDLYALRVGLDLDALPGLILSDRLDPDPANADEGLYYAAAVDALEGAVSMLRLAESRVHAYATFLDVAQAALLSAYDLTETWQGEVEEVEARLAEARHDHAVAKALLEEEAARIDGINARRADILDKNVELIGFARPRTVDRFTDAPGTALYAPFETPIPACLEADRDPPEELEEMLDDLREAPVGWFPDLADEIDRIDKARRLRDAWERARARAQDWLRRYRLHAQRIARAARYRRVAGKAATGVRLALAASRARWAAVLRARAERPLSELGALGWRALRDRATSELSMEDLAGAGKAGAALAREGLEELDRIGSVAACFLDALGRVPATIRLGWAETLSVRDTPPDLWQISLAGGWDRIPFEDRRLLEHLHGWLFSRIDVHDDEARAAMSEIVRVCLLLSSHAPVSEIVEGAAEHDKLLGPGETFEVAVGQGEAAVGMVATFSDALKRGYGMVDDIVGSKALVRITHAPDGMIAVSPATGVRFSKPVRRRLIRHRGRW